MATIRGKMVRTCDGFARRLSALASQGPAYRATYDRIPDLRNAADGRRRLHCLA